MLRAMCVEVKVMERTVPYSHVPHRIEESKFASLGRDNPCPMDLRAWECAAEVKCKMVEEELNAMSTVL
jgi:hypothetical protein